MQLYQFKTSTTSYYFPKVGKNMRYMYGLYNPYRPLIRILWWLFRHCAFVRWMNRVESQSLALDFNRLQNEIEPNAKLAINMGPPTVEQKISILGYKEGLRFFAKWSVSERAMQLTTNEINVYRLLKDTGLVPRLLGYCVAEDHVMLKAEFIEGDKPLTSVLTKEIVELAWKLSEYHIENVPQRMRTCLSHGDYCPWNILESKKLGQRLIDWELAAERPLGFDIFTYICNVSGLLYRGRPLIKAIVESKGMIDYYFSHFDINDWWEYLDAFTKEKLEYQRSKNPDGFMAKAFEELAEYLKGNEI